MAVQVKLRIRFLAREHHTTNSVRVPPLLPSPIPPPHPFSQPLPFPPSLSRCLGGRGNRYDSVQDIEK